MNRPIKKEMTKAPMTISGHIAIEEAIEVMRMWGMRNLPVTDSSEKLVGIISDRDFSRLLGSNLDLKSPVSEIMTLNPYCVLPETNLHEVVSQMAESKLGSAVVQNHNREVVGIFTTTDAMNILAELLDDDDSVEYKTLKISEYLFRPQYA